MDIGPASRTNRAAPCSKLQLLISLLYDVKSVTNMYKSSNYDVEELDGGVSGRRPSERFWSSLYSSSNATRAELTNHTLPTSRAMRASPNVRV